MLAQISSRLIDCTFDRLNTNLMFKCFVEVLQKFHSVNYLSPICFFLKIKIKIQNSLRDSRL